MWYSKIEKQDASNKTRIFHHVHATPQTYDFRRDSANEASGNRRRQTVHNGNDHVTSKSGQEIYGGYVFEMDQTSTEKDIVNMGVKNFQQGVADQMSDQYKNDGRFEEYGVYCMDFETTSDTAVGTTGYQWYYEKQSSYPSGNEESFMDTCSEEAS